MPDPIVNMTSGAERSEATKVAQVKNLYEMAMTRQGKFREEIMRNYRYVVGDQIDNEVLSKLREQKRPESITNLVHNVVLTEAGHLAGNRISMRAKPLRMGDEKGSSMRSALVSDWGIGYKGYYEIARAAVDAAIAKIGWVSTIWDTSEEYLGEPRVRCFDPMMVLIDPDARMLDQSDWRWQPLTGWYSAEEIIAMVPGMEEGLAEEMRDQARILEGTIKGGNMPTSWAERIQGSLADLINSKREYDRSGVKLNADGNYNQVVGTLMDYLDIRAGLYRVIDLHERRMVNRMWIYDMESGKKMMVPEEMAGNKEYVEAQKRQFSDPTVKNILVKQMWKTMIAPGLLPSKLVREKPYDVQRRGFEVKPIYCYDFHPDLLKTTSIVDAIIGPQDSYNQRHMSMLEWILRAVNPEIEAPKGSIDPEDMPDWLSKERGVIRFYKTKAGEKPEPVKPDASAVQIMHRLSEEDREIIPQLTGITGAVQGRAENSKEAASYYMEKVKNGMVNLAYLNRHTQEAMRGIFKYADGLIQKNMTVPRAIRLLKEPVDGIEGVVKEGEGKDEVYWMLVNWPTLDGVLNDVSQGDFDYEPDVTELGVTDKEVKFVEGSSLMKNLPPDMARIVAPYVVELWNNPQAKEIAGKLSAMLGMDEQAMMKKRALEEEAMKLKIAQGMQQQVMPGAQAQQRVS